MAKLLHASRSGYFPFCIESGNALEPTNFGITSPIGLAEAMEIYWKIKTLNFSFNLSAEYSFIFDSPVPLTIVNTLNISGTGTLNRAVDIYGNEGKLVCYNSSYLVWQSNFFNGVATEEDITTPDGPYSYDLSGRVIIQFLGFPNDSLQTIKRTPNNLYACGIRFEVGLESILPTGTISTFSSLGEHNFECGTFSSPIFGEVPLFWSISGLDTGDFSFISGSASGNLSVEISEYIDWS